MISPAVNELTAHFPDEIQKLLDMLCVSNLGGLAVASCDDFELRTQLIDYFRRYLENKNIYVFNFEVSPKDTNLVHSLTELTDHHHFQNLEQTGKYKAVVIFVYGIEKFNDKQRDQFIRLLNFLRDRLTMIAQPLVIWGTAVFVNRLVRNTPDFWNEKGHFFNFPTITLPAGNGQTVNNTADFYNNLPPLQRYVHNLIKEPDYAALKDLYIPLKAKRAKESSSPFLPRHTLTFDELRQLAPLFHDTVSFEANRTIFKRGDWGETCYIIVSGEVEIMIADTVGNDMIIAKLSKGDFFGEISMLNRIPRTTTIRTTKPAKFVPLTHHALSLLNHKAPAVLNTLTKVAQWRLETRLQDPQEVLSPLRRFANSATGGHSQSYPVDVRDLIAHDRQTVILGDTGAGKTTVLRRMMIDTAKQAEYGLMNEQKPVVLPVFLKLNMLLSPDKTVEGLILDMFRSYEIYEFETEADIVSLLNDQNPAYNIIVHSILFLMDGLNEIALNDKAGQELDRFIQNYGQHRYIITCRVQDYTTMYNFRTALLQHLSGKDIEDFLVNYLQAEKGRKVARQIYSDPQLEDLAQTALALYMFVQIAKNSEESFPKNRGMLFETFTTNLLERIDSEWWKVFGRSKAETPLILRKNALAMLGLSMQEEETWLFSLERWLSIIAKEAHIFKNSAAPGERVSIEHLTPQDIHEEIKHSGLIRYAETRSWVEFSHHTYQEFFAALAKREHGYDIEPYLRTVEGRRRWQGTVILLYGIAYNKGDLYSKILGTDNDYARIWLAAQALANSGEDVTLTLQQLERSLPLQQHFALLFSVGLASRQMGRYPEALTYLHMASEEMPGSAEIQYEIGSLYCQVEQYERAIQHLEEAISLRSDFVDAYNQLGITYYDQKKYVEALTIFKATTQLEPNNAHHFYNLGTVQKILRDYNSASNSFQIAIEIKPDYSEARTQLDILEKALSTGVVRVLENIPILSKMTLEQIVLLANRIKVKNVEAGHIIFHMGEMGDTFFIIEVGKVEVLAHDIGRRSKGVINRLKAGDFFGEIALLRTVPRTATIRAVKQTRLLGISREDFDLVIKKYPAIAHRMAETSSLRLLRDRQIGRRVDLDRYYDPGYIAELTQQNEVTVLMGDIHGSTYLTNSIGPELMVAFLDEYLRRMSVIIVQGGGAMDKSLGDSVMGVFGATPGHHNEDKATSANLALLAALKMREAYILLRDEWKRESPEFAQTGMGIGVSTGKVKTGTVGSEATMVGPAVNMSSKLSKMSVNGRTESELYIDARTLSLTGQAFLTELLDVAYTKKKVGFELEAYRVLQRRR